MTVMVVMGCGEGAPPAPKLEPVTGTVTLDGAPLERAVLSFLPKESTGQVAVGVTDATGKYEAEYPGSLKGVPAGQYKVLITKLVTPSGDPIPEGKSAADVEAKDIIPAKYRRMDDLVNVVSIPAGGKADLNFELKTK